jgi:hypothetical protein
MTPFGILDLQLLITPFVSSDYPFGILDLQLLITPFGFLN